MQRFFCLVTLTVLMCRLSSCDDNNQPITEQDRYKWTSQVSSIPTDEQTVENLVILGRVWGFLKYYHPVVASGKYNWDYELFKIMPLVIAARTADERNNVLAVWVDSVGGFTQLDSVPIIDSSSVKLWPDYSWINAISLGKKLSEQLELVLTAKRDGNNHYVKLTKGVNNPVFVHEEKYDSLQFPDAGYRMLCLFRYWNMMEYFNPNKHLISRSWDSVLIEFVPHFINCKTELDYELIVMKMVAEVNDSHARTYGDINAFNNFKGDKRTSVFLTFVEGKPVVSGFVDKVSEQSSGLQKGDVIKSVDYIGVDTLIKQNLQYISSSNMAAGLRDVGGLLLRTNKSQIHIVFERDGESKHMDLKCDQNKETRSNGPYNDADSAIIIVNSEISRIYPGSATANQVDSAFEDFRNNQGIIIDFRCYPNDDFIGVFARFLFPTTLPFAKYTNTSITSPGLFEFTNTAFRGKSKNSEYYKGKVVVIVNEYTQSAAEYQTMALRAAPGTIIIGSPTAGADGNVSEINLPGGIKTMISGIGILYPNGRETQRIGIVPDIEVYPTIKGIREGRDELMEKAIEIINEK